jgi:hypothetical protein
MGMKRRLTLKILGVCVASSLLTLAVTAHAPTRVVAIADVHGAYTELVTILQRTMLIEGKSQWVGGSATLVQTGDVMDRGAQTRDCLDLLMDLESQAEKAGGKLIPLLGNHEVMNLMNDLRYVTPAIYRSFGTEQSEKVRDEAYQNYLKFQSAHREHIHGAALPNDEAERKKWMDAHPPGYFEYVDALGPQSKYGRWIRKHHAITQLGDGLFVHGGLSPNLKFRNIAELDDQIHTEISDFDSIWQSLSDKKVIWRYMTLAEAVQCVGEEMNWIQSRGRVDDPGAVQEMQKLLGYQSWMCVSSEGPLWYRGLAQDPEEKLMDGVMAMLARLRARFIVEGHTVLSKSDIIPRFENHVFLIDTGMNREEYQGRPSALEIQDGRFTAYYADGEPKVLTAPASGKTAEPNRPEPSGRVEVR